MNGVAFNSTNGGAWWFSWREKANVARTKSKKMRAYTYICCGHGIGQSVMRCWISTAYVETATAMQIVSGTARLDIQPKLTDFDALRSTGEGIAAIIPRRAVHFSWVRVDALISRSEEENWKSKVVLRFARNRRDIKKPDITIETERFEKIACVLV